MTDKDIRKKALLNLVEKMANPREAIHDEYKEKMKQILLIYSGYVFALVEERKHKMTEFDLIKLTDEFVEKSFNKAT